MKCKNRIMKELIKEFGYFVLFYKEGKEFRVLFNHSSKFKIDLRNALIKRLLKNKDLIKK